MILAPERWHPLLGTILEGIDGYWRNADITASLDRLTGGEVLIAFGSGVIVPPDVLARYKRAYNFHGGPPEYPGRDPHHWAVYDGAKTFGVTLHRMTAKVDDGTIIATHLFPIAGMGPQEVRRYTELWLLTLFHQYAVRLYAADPGDAGSGWRGTKRSRADLLAMLDCRGLSTEEVVRRKRAFEGFDVRTS